MFVVVVASRECIIIFVGLELQLRTFFGRLRFLFSFLSFTLHTARNRDLTSSL
jgi:hypothetical protein